jgi:hypothetical protein
MVWLGFGDFPRWGDWLGWPPIRRPSVATSLRCCSTDAADLFARGRSIFRLAVDLGGGHPAELAANRAADRLLGRDSQGFAAARCDHHNFGESGIGQIARRERGPLICAA